MLKVKQILLFSLFILWATICKSQVSYYGMALLKSQKLEAFKKTTTLFTLQYADYAELEKFDRAIKKNWTITPYKIIKPEELASYETLANYSFFYFDGYAEKLDNTIIYYNKRSPSRLSRNGMESFIIDDLASLSTSWSPVTLPM